MTEAAEVAEAVESWQLHVYIMSQGNRKRVNRASGRGIRDVQAEKALEAAEVRNDGDGRK